MHNIPRPCIAGSLLEQTKDLYRYLAYSRYEQTKSGTVDTHTGNYQREQQPAYQTNIVDSNRDRREQELALTIKDSSRNSAQPQDERMHQHYPCQGNS